MNCDAEFAVLSRKWQARSDAQDNARLAQDLKHKVTRESRLMKIWLSAPILVTIGVGGVFIARTRTFTSVPDIVLAAEVWIFILVTWIGCLWLARGTWRPLGETTAAFVDLSIRRCRSNLRGVAFGAWLYIAQVLFMLLWSFYSTSVELTVLLTTWPVILLGWLGLPMVFAGKAWFVRRQRAKLDHFLELQRQLQMGPD